MHKNNESDKLESLHQEILTMTEISSNEYLNETLGKIIQIKDKCITSEIIKVCFTLLEKGLILSKNTLFFESVCEFILEKSKDTNLTQYFRMILAVEQCVEMFNLLLNSSTINLFVDILKNDKDVKILKNCSVILTNFYEKSAQCINLEDLDFLLESEHLFYRSAFLCIIYKQISIELKGLPDKLSDIQLERICHYISIITERTLDYHSIIRAKALSILGLLFKDRFIPKNIRKKVIESINQRLIDKTQMVRKKAILSLKNVLLFHPFLLNNGSLEVKNDDNSEYSKDLQEFVEQIKMSLKNIKILIKEESKLEVEEILGFLNLAYFYKIKETISVYEDLFIYSQNNYELLNNTIISLLDLFTQLPDKILNFFFEFEPTSHLQLIIQLVARKKIFKNEIFNILFKKIKEKKNYNYFKKVIFFLSCSAKYLDLEIKSILELIQYISDQLFNSKDHSDLINNVQVFRSMLNLVINYKNKGLNNEIIHKLIKIFVKMNFFDPEINKKIIKICFESGKEYEKNIMLFFKMINTKNTNKLKLIYSVGCIVEEQGKLLDIIESKVKKIKNFTKDDERKIRESIKNNEEVRRSITSEIKERRKSITLSRVSFHGKGSDVFETEKLLEKVKNKPEEEILDILFYVKEREILYSPNALLSPYIKLIIDGCKDNDNEIVNVSYLSLLKCMSISSIFFEENINLFFKGIAHSDKRIRNNCVITIRDFFLNYNFILEKKCHLLFSTLNDSDQLVRKHSIFIIFDLLIKNIIKLKNSSLLLSELLIDKDEEIKKISYYLFNKLVKNSMVNNSLVPNIFYESLLFTDKSKIKELMVVFFTLISDKAKEVCFIKFLRNKEYDKELAKFYLEKANFSEKFIDEMKAFEEFNELLVN